MVGIGKEFISNFVKAMGAVGGALTGQKRSLDEGIRALGSDSLRTSEALKGGGADLLSREIAQMLIDQGVEEGEVDAKFRGIFKYEGSDDSDLKSQMNELLGMVKVAMAKLRSGKDRDDSTTFDLLVAANTDLDLFSLSDLLERGALKGLFREEQLALFDAYERDPEAIEGAFEAAIERQKEDPSFVFDLIVSANPELDEFSIPTELENSGLKGLSQKKQREIFNQFKNNPVALEKAIVAALKRQDRR